MSILPPTEQRGRNATRAIIEGLAQLNSVTAAVATLYRFTHPSMQDQLRDAWTIKMTDAVNDHERRLAAMEGFLTPRLVVGPLALEIASLIVRESEDGLSWPIFVDDLVDRFPGEDGADVEEAIFELVSLGLLSGSDDTQVVTIEYDLFATLDPALKGYTTIDDAKVIAREMLADDEMTWIPNLDKKLCWEPRRRLPPAFLPAWRL